MGDHPGREEKGVSTGTDAERCTGVLGIVSDFFSKCIS